MKISVIIEINDSNKVSFDKTKRYPVLKNYNNYDLLGFCFVDIINDKLVGTFSLKDDYSGLFPAIGYTVKGKEFSLLCVGLCDQPNEDKNIKAL